MFVEDQGEHGIASAYSYGIASILTLRIIGNGCTIAIITKEQLAMEQLLYRDHLLFESQIDKLLPAPGSESGVRLHLNAGTLQLC